VWCAECIACVECVGRVVLSVCLVKYFLCTHCRLATPIQPIVTIYQGTQHIQQGNHQNYYTANTTTTTQRHKPAQTTRPAQRTQQRQPINNCSFHNRTPNTTTHYKETNRTAVKLPTQQWHKTNTNRSNTSATNTF